LFLLCKTKNNNKGIAMAEQGEPKGAEVKFDCGENILRLAQLVVRNTLEKPAKGFSILTDEELDQIMYAEEPLNAIFARLHQDGLLLCHTEKRYRERKQELSALSEEELLDKATEIGWDSEWQGNTCDPGVGDPSTELPPKDSYQHIIEEILAERRADNPTTEQ
jgi:hypothetical protein